MHPVRTLGALALFLNFRGVFSWALLVVRVTTRCKHGRDCERSNRRRMYIQAWHRTLQGLIGTLFMGNRNSSHTVIICMGRRNLSRQLAYGKRGMCEEMLMGRKRCRSPDSKSKSISRIRKHPAVPNHGGVADILKAYRRIAYVLGVCGRMWTCGCVKSP